MPLDHLKWPNFSGDEPEKCVWRAQWKEKWEEISCHILMNNGINSQGISGLGVNDRKKQMAYVREASRLPGDRYADFQGFPGCAVAGIQGAFGDLCRTA